MGGTWGEKQLVYSTQKQGRDTHREKRGMGIFSNEGERNTSETRQRPYPERRVGILSEECSMEVKEII